MIKNSMTRIRVNFLLAFEGANLGRPATATRLQLQQFVDSNAGKMGPLNLPINFPSWLTNPNPNEFKVGRGNYRLPWDELDRYKTDEAARLKAQAAELAAKAHAVSQSPPSTSNAQPGETNATGEGESSEEPTDEPAETIV